MDGLQEVQAYLKTGVTPPGFSVMPISPEQAPEEAAAKMGKRPEVQRPEMTRLAALASARMLVVMSMIFLQPLHWSFWIWCAVKVPAYDSVCPLCSGQDTLAAKVSLHMTTLAEHSRLCRQDGCG